VNEVGFPRHRTAELGVAGLQTRRHDEAAGVDENGVLVRTSEIEEF